MRKHGGPACTARLAPLRQGGPSTQQGGPATTWAHCFKDKVMHTASDEMGFSKNKVALRLSGWMREFNHNVTFAQDIRPNRHTGITVVTAQLDRQKENVIQTYTWEATLRQQAAGKWTTLHKNYYHKFI